MSDDLLRDAARRAFAPIVAATPALQEWDDIESAAGPSRAKRTWKPLMAATAAALGVIAVVLVAVLIARGSPIEDAAQPSVAPETVAVTTASAITAPPPEEATASFVVAQLGPDPLVETADPLTFLAIDSPFVALVTRSDLTRATVIGLEHAAQLLLDSVGAASPYTVKAAFTRRGNMYSVVSFDDASRGLIVVGDDPYRSWFQEESWIDVRYTRRGDVEPYVELVWLGVPDGASHVTISSPEYTDNPPQRVIASSAFAAMPKPFWTQYVTLNALAPDGELLASREVLVDGSTCSAGKQNPQPLANDDLSDTVDAARRAMFAEIVGCRLGVLEIRATGSNELFFGAGSDALARTLREMDRRSAFMLSMRSALLLGAREESRGGETVYVFESSDMEIVIDADGQWISARLTG